MKKFKEINNEDMKKIILDILTYIHEICEKNGLRYHVVGGTLIGAVRHKGFIPWDDDVDIHMPRPDYEKLKKILHGNNKYKFLTEDDEGYFYSFGKIVDLNTILIEKRMRTIKDMGVYIDVFPVDGLPDGDIRNEYFCEMSKIKEDLFFWGRMRPILSKKPFELLKNIVTWLKSRSYDVEVAKKMLKEMRMKHNYDSSKYVCCVGGRYGLKEIFPRSLIEGVVKGEFEGQEVNLPERYDELLTRMYGDYMQLPPVEQRVSNHDFVAYWKEDVK